MYLFDAWPRYHALIRQTLNALEVRVAFISSRQAAERLNQEAQFTHYEWVPEGVTLDKYEPLDSSQKNVDLIQLGRKHDSYH